MIFGFEIVAAKSARDPQEDAPVQQSMRPAGIRTSVSTDQKKVRRAMSRGVHKKTADLTDYQPDDLVVVDGAAQGVYVGPDFLGTPAPGGTVWVQIDGDVAAIDPSRITGLAPTTASRTTQKEPDMSRDREVQILQAMAVATPGEQMRLAADLEALRSGRIASMRAEASLDLSNTLVAAHLTPVAVHERNTSATDWISTLAVSADDPTLSMKTEATMWFSRVSPEVRADREEFAIQAQGFARRVAGKHGERMAMAERAFLDHVAHLHRMAADGPAVNQSGEAQSTVTDYRKLDQATDEPAFDEGWASQRDADQVTPPMPGAGESTASRKRASSRKTAERNYVPISAAQARQRYEAGLPIAAAGETWWFTNGAAGDTVQTWFTKDSLGMSFDELLPSSGGSFAAPAPLSSDASRKSAGAGPVGISQEGTGDPSRTWVVRQGETWIGAYASEDEARAAAEGQGFTVISRRGTKTAGGQTCSTCGASIERDPAGEANRSWHHNDGASHDHEAKPGKESAKTAGWDGLADFGAFQGSLDDLSQKIKESSSVSEAISNTLPLWSSDSADREIAFQFIAKAFGVDYDAVYDTWDAGYVPGASGGYGYQPTASRRTAAENVAEENRQSGDAISGLPQVEVGGPNDRPAWPWEMDQNTPGTGAADVADVPTPGDANTYPQPKGASRRVTADGVNLSALHLGDQVIYTRDGSSNVMTVRREIEQMGAPENRTVSLTLGPGMFSTEVSYAGIAAGYYDVSPMPTTASRKGASRRTADFTLDPAYRQGHTDGYNGLAPASDGEAYTSGYQDGWSLGVQFGAIVSPVDPPIYSTSSRTPAAFEGAQTAAFRARVQAGLAKQADDFWKKIDTALDTIAAGAKTFDDVKKALDPSIDQTYPRTYGADDTFFSGSGGDRTLSSALRSAGWSITNVEGGYYWIARSPSGEWITYTEGDVHRGITQSILDQAGMTADQVR